MYFSEEETINLIHFVLSKNVPVDELRDMALRLEVGGWKLETALFEQKTWWPDISFLFDDIEDDADGKKRVEVVPLYDEAFNQAIRLIIQPKDPLLENEAVRAVIKRNISSNFEAIYVYLLIEEIPSLLLPRNLYYMFKVRPLGEGYTAKPKFKAVLESVLEELCLAQA